MKAARAGDLVTAKEQCEAAIAASPNLEHAYLLLGSSCALLDDPVCEKDAYDRGLAALPSSAALLKERGLLHVEAGEIDAAIASYEKAVELTGGKQPEYQADLAYAYAYAGRLEEAEALAKQATAADPKCFPCAMALGQVMLSQKRFKDAVGAFQGALVAQPDDPDAKRSVGKAHFLAGDLERAAEIYEALAAADPDDARVRVQAAQVAMKRKKFADAARHLSHVEKSNPDNRELLELLMEAQKKAGDAKGARATQTKLRALDK